MVSLNFVAPVFLDVDTRTAKFNVWTGLYNRFDVGLQPRERLEDITMAAMEHVGVLESHVAQLRMRVAELKGQISGSAQSQMVDSGTSSATDELTVRHPLDGVSPTLERATSLESGVMDNSFYFDSSLSRISLKWQPLRGVTRCANPACRGEFPSPIDRRIHCYRCGLIFCRRCVRVTADDRERICDKCKTED